MDTEAALPFSPRVEEALAAALNAHHGQVRMGRADVPYAVHPLHVAWMLRRYTEDEEVLVAALLHDVVEDSEDWSRERVTERFGARVAGIVDELSEDPELSWRARKEGGIDGVGDLTPEAALVKACDHLHNLASLEANLCERDPESVWAGFHGGRAGTLAVARGLAEALAPRVPAALGRALRRLTERIEQLAAEAG